MAVQTIQNIINYNSEEMEEKLRIAQEQYDNDPVRKGIKEKLNKQTKRSLLTCYICLGAIIPFFILFYFI